MNPNDIELKNLSNIFEYEKLSRELDNCDNIDEIREKAKYCVKLYLSVMEVYKDLGVILKR